MKCTDFKYCDLIEFLPSKKRNIILFDRKFSIAKLDAELNKALIAHYLPVLTEQLNNETVLCDMLK